MTDAKTQKVVALDQVYIDGQGLMAKGDEFETTVDHAKQLIAKALAKAATEKAAPAEKRASPPKNKKAAKPANKSRSK